MKTKNISRVDRVFFSVTGTEKDERLEMGFEKRFKRNEDGFLEGRAPVTNIGVFTYALPDGSVRRELRSPEEVFSQESLDSLIMKPVTNDHPTVAVSPENSKELQVGSLGEVIDTDAYRVFATMSITEDEAINDVLEGKRALSCGYYTDLVMESGVWMGVEYDAIQTNIRYNHVAIVQEGRAGDDVVMTFDSAHSVGRLTQVVTLDSSNAHGTLTQPKEKGNIMKKIKLDGVEYDAEGEVIKALHKADASLKDAEGEIVTLKSDASTLQAKLDSETEKVSGLEADIVKLKEDSKSLVSAENLDSLVKSKIALMSVAEQAGIEIKEDSADVDIKKAIITKAFPKADEAFLKDKDSAYIEARFDSAVEILENGNQVLLENGKTVADRGLDEGNGGRKVANADEARKKMIADQKQAHKSKREGK